MSPALPRESLRALETKVPPVIVAAILAGLMWLADSTVPSAGFTFPGRTPIVGLFVAAAVISAWAGVRAFRRARTSVDPLRPGKATVLVTDGVYRVTRNPMYLGMLFLLAALALFFGNLLCFIGPVLFVAYMNRFQIVPEERALLDRFGDAYRSYRSSVRRWL